MLVALFALVSLDAAADEAAAPDTAAAPRPALIAPLAQKSTLLSIAAAGEALVAVGQRGHILRSEDGERWAQVQAPVDAMLNRVRFHDARRGWAVGHDATILATPDGGRTWTLQHFDAGGPPLYDVIALAEGRALAVGGYGAVYLDDGSGRWQRQSFPVADLGQHFNAITRLGDGSLLVAGERGLVARSADDGGSWTLLRSPYAGSFFGAVPLGERGVLVYGLRGHLYTAADAGLLRPLDPATYDPFQRETVTGAAALAAIGWKELGSGTTEGLFGHGVAGSDVLIVGVNGVAVRVDPLAGRAARLASGAGETLADVLWVERRWIAVGRRGVQDLGALPWP